MKKIRELFLQNLLQDEYAWIFLEPNIQTTLLKVTHIHHYRKRHVQEHRAYSHICLYSCLCARQVVPAACVSSPWGLGCPVHGSRKQLTAPQSSLNEVVRFRLTLPLGPSPLGAGPLKTLTAQRFWLFAPLSPQSQNCGNDGQGLLG